MRKYTIAKRGMGGMLNPPNHAEHNFCVVDGFGGSMSLTCALKDDHVPEKFKEQIQILLSLRSGDFTEEWEHTCYNYFRNCYSPDPDDVDRDLSNCVIIDSDRSYAIVPERHLAYLHIKSFFPDYKPNEHLIKNNGDKGRWSSAI